jgi:murein DD-endopeptidase MepM/ murein hydrolase activator NlpD
MSQYSSKAAATKSGYAGAGKRRAAVKADTRRGGAGSTRWFLRMPPVFALLGLAAVAAASGGAINGDPVRLTDAEVVRSAEVRQHPTQAIRARSRVVVVSRSAPRRERQPTVDVAAAVKRREQALRQLRGAADRHEQALRQAAEDAERRRREIEANRWTLPVTSYRLTATFGQSSYLWSTTHTGLDFAAPEGTPIHSVGTGTVTEVGYAGSYGYRTIVTHRDGTEVWYCHQASIGVSTGEAVGRGEVIGLVGSTGNVTGPHLHLEVRPGGGDPDDPYTALAARGARP